VSTLLRNLVLFLVLSGLVHIFTIVATPFFAQQKVWQRITQRIEPRKIAALNGYFDAVATLGQADPSMVYAICHFSLENGPVTITANGPTSFWNATLYNSNAEVIYSLNDDISQFNQLNLSVSRVTPLSEEKPDETIAIPPPSAVEKNVPSPTPSPALEEGAQEGETDLQVSDEDGSRIEARVSENEVFMVLKVFQLSRHHAKLIEGTIETAECK